jgi:hypothetical protein
VFTNNKGTTALQKGQQTNFAMQPVRSSNFFCTVPHKKAEEYKYNNNKKKKKTTEP